MAQSGYGLSTEGGMGHNTMPSAPMMGSASVGDDIGAPPSYEEALRASGGSFGNMSTSGGADGGVAWHPALSGGASGSAGWRPDVMEAGTAGPDQTTTASAEPAPQATNSAGHSNGDDPPSYQSLFGQIKDAKQSSSGICDFISKVFLMPLGCLVGLVIIAVLLALVFGVPITLISVGFYYISDCPVAPGVPIWMVVGGAVMLLYMFRTSSSKEESGCLTICACLFYIAWYIAGAVLIYPNWQPAFEPRYPFDSEYCDYTLFMTAFIFINLLSVFTGVVCCMSSLS